MERFITPSGMILMSDQSDLTPEQMSVINKLLPQVQRLIENGMTENQIINALVLVEGWPIGAVLEALSQHHPSVLSAKAVDGNI